jgi:hypothetical protein
MLPEFASTMVIFADELLPVKFALVRYIIIINYKRLRNELRKSRVNPRKSSRTEFPLGK